MQFSFASPGPYPSHAQHLRWRRLSLLAVFLLLLAGAGESAGVSADATGASTVLASLHPSCA